MSATETELGPLVGHIQTDSFCETCGYNLHTQPVMRDARLGILVSRCPECGRFNAAGRTTAANQPWLNRLAIALLLFWILFLLVFFGLGTLFLGMTAYAHASEGTTFRQIQVPFPGNPKMTYTKFEQVVDDGTGKTAEQRAIERQQMIALVVFAAILSMIVGGAFSVFFWHCRGLRRALALVPPLIACGFARFIWTTDARNARLAHWGRWHIAQYAAWQIVWVLIGLFIGRPFARAALTILLPPKVRQHLAFLWTRDGKRLSIQNEL